MKNKVKLLIYFLLSVCALSCNQQPIENNSQIEQPLTEKDKYFLRIIRFTNPSYKEHILATDLLWKYSYPRADSVFFAFELNEDEGPEMNEKTIEELEKWKTKEHFPYIDLVDDFLLVDWRWNFSRLYSKMYANIDNTILLEEKWSDLKSYTQEWPRTVPNDHEAIDSVILFRIWDIDKYRGESSPYFDRVLSLISEQERDSLQQIYVECLKEILSK